MSRVSLNLNPIFSEIPAAWWLGHSPNLMDWRSGAPEHFQRIDVAADATLMSSVFGVCFFCDDPVGVIGRRGSPFLG
jgi:hypothetical protein